MFIVEHTTPRESIDSIASSPTLQSPSDILDSADDYVASDSQYFTVNSQEELEYVAQDSQETETSIVVEDKSDKIKIKNAMKPSKKKRKVETEDAVIEAATKSLKEIEKAIVAGNTSNNETPQTNNVSQSEIFGNFVTKQMSFIEEHDEDLFLDIQHEISDIIYNARKECKSNKM